MNDISKKAIINKGMVREQHLGKFNLRGEWVWGRVVGCTVRDRVGQTVEAREGRGELWEKSVFVNQGYKNGQMSLGASSFTAGLLRAVI